ncbi:hypothetical protein KAU33_15865 [Candidatus Dependentiae bacterium]|nr:hypothetical protein [Candidatus Dependentiae bacterium]
MSRNYYGKNGELFNVNVDMRSFLEKITFCLWNKVGIPGSLSKEDALLVSRILTNYIELQGTTSGDDKFGKYFWSKYGFEQDNIEELNLVRETASFFERSNGLLNEHDWSVKFESDED